ncbi:MAG: ParA family protein, partial [Thermoanaerobaculaceae bacterium]|nr:ParA family protein [Thermoanaerobaculaceae bacterium]
MAVIISVANQKGGVGKTTTVINLGASLAAAEKRVLIVDFDPQTNCTSGFGFPRRSENPTIYDLLTGRTSPKDAVVKSELPNLSIILGSIALAGAEVELANLEKGREQVLKNILDPLRKDYDYILIDCPPSLG